jgi:hypothetical protein
MLIVVKQLCAFVVQNTQETLLSVTIHKEPCPAATKIIQAPLVPICDWTKSLSEGVLPHMQRLLKGRLNLTFTLSREEGSQRVRHSIIRSQRVDDGYPLSYISTHCYSGILNSLSICMHGKD